MSEGLTARRRVFTDAKCGSITLKVSGGKVSGQRLFKEKTKNNIRQRNDVNELEAIS
jgi:hypothetical protein